MNPLEEVDDQLMVCSKKKPLKDSSAVHNQDMLITEVILTV